MTTSTKPTLVMGARGNIGRLVLEQLHERGLPVRVSARRPEPGWFPDDVDVHAADLTDPATLAPAFEGVGQVFLYAPDEGADGVVDALRAARVERVVLLSSGSVLHPTSAGNGITEHHREVEQAFVSAPDLTVVPLHPFALATNALNWTRPIRATGKVAIYQPDARTAPVHERDIAAVAVEALTGRDDVEALLTGPDRLSQRDQVTMIGTAIGRSIEIEELSREAAFAQLARFMPGTEVEAILRFQDDAAAGNSGATPAVEQILGRPALPFSVWAEEHAADFR